MDFDQLKAHVEATRNAVRTDPRRSHATASFRRIYGVPNTHVMDSLAQHGLTLVRADAAVFGLIEDTGVLWHGAAHCEQPSALLRGELLVEWAAVAGTPLLFDEVSDLPGEFADVRALGWRGVAAMPLLNEGVSVGALLMGRMSGVPWSEAERRALDAWMAMNAILNDRRAESVAEAMSAGAAADMRFGTIFERAPMGLVLVDDRGRFEAVNPAFAELAGHPRDWFVGRHVRDVSLPLENDPTAGYLNEMLSGKRRSYTVDRKLLTPDGKTRLIKVTTAQLRFARDGAASHLAVIEDVTEQRKAENELRDREDQLRHAQKMEAIGQLAGGLAHDFSNTLAAISGFASLLREDTPVDDARRRDVEGILRVTQRASSITRKLLTISKKQVQERATVDLREVLEEFSTLVRPVLPSSIRYALEVPKLPLYATIDRMQIEQALLNLALNAGDAMPSGGTLTVTLGVVEREVAPGRTSPHARIAVADTGAGIPPELMSRLWEPFFTTKVRGSGLGLPMSRAILREHGGDLEAGSARGGGAEFTILIPVADAGARPARDSSTPVMSLAAPKTGLTVLLADDEDAVRVTSGRLLERAGFTVLSAADGAEAWRLFLAHIDAIDVVVTDLIMPELSGRDLVRRIRANVADMPVVVTSAYPPDSDHDGGTAADADPVNATLVKPFTGSVLVQTVRGVLAQSARHPG